MPVHAEGRYWDGTSTGPDADGGEGTWINATSPTNWSTSATSGFPVDWNDGTGNAYDAVFGGTGGVVTVSGTVSAGSLSFTSAGYRLSGGVVTLTFVPTIHLNGNDVEIESAIAGGAAIGKYGTGTLTLSGNNTFSHDFTVAAGKVKVGNAKALGTTARGTFVLSGATLDLNGTSVGQEDVTISGTGVGGAGAIVNHGASIDAAFRILSLSGNASIGGTAPWEILSGYFNLNLNGYTLSKIGVNDIRLVRSPVIGGNIVVKAGRLIAEDTSFTGDATKSISVQGGATLALVRNIAVNSDWTADFAGNSTWEVTHTCRWKGPVSLSGAVDFKTKGGASMSMEGATSGAGSFTKSGLDPWTLSGANAHTGGTTVNEGALVLNMAASAGAGTLRGAVHVNEGGTLTLAKVDSLGATAALRVSPLNVNGGLVDSTIAASNTAGVINLTGGRLRSNGGVPSATAASCYTLADGSVVNGLAAAIPSVISGRLHLGTGNTNDTTVFHVADGAAEEDMQIHAVITGAGAANGITKRGDGVLALRGPALFTGPTVVEAGTLLLDGDGALEDSTVTVASGARLVMVDAGESLAGLTAKTGSTLVLPALTEGGTVVEGTLNLESGMIGISPMIGAGNPEGVYDLLVADNIIGSGTPVLDLSGAIGGTNVTGHVVVNGNKLQLVITSAGANLVWRNATEDGDKNGTWNTTLNNFFDGVGHKAFLAFDAVAFDDSVAAGQVRKIALDGVLTPSLVTVRNSSGEYVFSSTGRLAGAGSLVKTGLGRLTVAEDTGYAMSGPIVAGGGVLDFLGQSISAATLTVKSEGVLKNATVEVGAMDLQSGTVNAKLSGDLPWTKSTAGTVTLTEDNMLSGMGAVAEGHLVMGSLSLTSLTGTLGSGPVVISPGAAVTFRNASVRGLEVANDFSGNGSLKFEGVNDGSNGISNFTLKGDNSGFSGPVTVANSRLLLPEGTQTGSEPITLTGSAALAANAVTVPNALVLNTTSRWYGSGSSGGPGYGSLILTNATLTGPITLPGGIDTTIHFPGTTTANSTISGPIGQAGDNARVSFVCPFSDSVLTLSGASTYTGSTAIRTRGTLKLTGSLGPTAVSVMYGSLAGNGVIGSGGSLTFVTGSPSLGESTLKVVSPGGALTVNGNVNLGTSTKVILDVTPEAAAAGPIPVLNFTGTLTGTAANLAIKSSLTPSPFRQAVFAIEPGLITVDLGSKELVWKGASNTAWETAAGVRWGTSDTGVATDIFYRGDRVIFNDSGAGGTISGEIPVEPSAVVVNNNSKSYTINTPIFGPCSIEKYGTGDLGLNSANHTGGTTAHAGRLSMRGSGPVTIKAAASLIGGPIDGPVTIAGMLDPGGSISSRIVVGTGSLTLSGRYHCGLFSSNSDQVVVTGDLDLTGSKLTLASVQNPSAITTSYVIATYTGMLTGGFTAVNGAPAGWGVKYDAVAKQILIERMNFPDWIASFPGLSDTTDGGDPDGDSIPNLVEYVVGGNPGAGDSLVLPKQTIIGNNLRFQYRRSDASRDLTTQTVQWSPDMINWTDIAIPLTSAPPVTISANGSLPDDVAVIIPRIPGAMFVRLRVTRP